jgi:peptidoglycan/LPS O-acetylase OafA/YrhL
LHILVFFSGLLTAKYYSLSKDFDSKKNVVFNKIVFASLFSSIIIIMVILKYYWKQPAMKLLPILLLIILGIHAFRHTIIMVPIDFFGRISYSLYLFHITFFCIIKKLMLDVSHIPDIFIIFILFMLFCIICINLKKIGQYVALIFMKLIIKIDKILINLNNKQNNETNPYH